MRTSKLRCLQVPNAYPRVNKLDAAPLLPVIFRFSVFSFHVWLHRLLVSDGGRRRWRHTFLPVSAVGTGELRALQLCPTVLLASMMFRDCYAALLFRVSDIANVFRKCVQVGAHRSLRQIGRVTCLWRTSRRPSSPETTKRSM